LERETAEIDFGVGDLCAWVWSIMGARAAVKQTQRIDTVIFHSILKFLSIGVVNLHLWDIFLFCRYYSPWHMVGLRSPGSLVMA